MKIQEMKASCTPERSEVGTKSAQQPDATGLVME